METNSQNKWWSRGITLAVWALAAASVAWWGLRLAGSSSAALPPPTSAVTELVVDAKAVASALGVTVAAPELAPAPASAASRFALLGVVANRASLGAALISIDGKPARPYRVGSRVEDNWVLQAVEPRRARLGATAGDAATLVLDMPPVKK